MGRVPRRRYGSGSTEGGCGYLLGLFVGMWVALWVLTHWDTIW